MKAKFVILLIVLFTILVGYFGMLCGVDSKCVLYPYLNHYSFTLFKPMWVYGLFCLPVPLTLFFVRGKVLRSWLPFAYWFVPLSAILIALSPTWSSSWFPLYSFVKEETAQFMAVLFTIISLGIIGWKQFGTKK